MKLEFEQVNIVDGIAIVAIGVGFIAGIFTGQENIALTCIGALGGYVGSVINNSSKGNSAKE